VLSPAAARAALANHRAAIDPALAKILEIVGSYAGVVIHCTYLFTLLFDMLHMRVRYWRLLLLEGT
jgi:hypothetical protein